MTTIYADAAPLYVKAGWPGVLPVGHRPKLKAEPPTGTTGHTGRWPTDDDVAGWRSSLASVNVALRLPPTIVGIDVDDYGGKNGADTLAAGVAAHGELPATWTTTSRDGASGISLFGIPAGTTFGADLHHPTKNVQSGVDIIQFHHRYAVVPPSATQRARMNGRVAFVSYRHT